MRKTLLDTFRSLDGADEAWKFRHCLVWKEFDARDFPWPGTHKNVTYWCILDKGYAIGFNENPAIGISFPIISKRKIANLRRSSVDFDHKVMNVVSRETVKWLPTEG